MSKPSDPTYIGSVYGEWTVIEELEERSPRKGHIVYVVQCSCGDRAQVQGVSLRRGTSTKCRKCADIKAGKARARSQRLGPGVSSFHKVYGAYRTNARKRNYDFNISREDFLELVLSNCNYCGAGPSNIITTVPPEGTFIYNGVDRVNNSLGYSADNCVACCKTCNRIKMDHTVEELMEHIARMIKTYEENKNASKKERN